VEKPNAKIDSAASSGGQKQLKAHT